MNGDRDRFRSNLISKNNNEEIVSSSEIKEGYDMQSYPIVLLIDDDENLKNKLKKQLPSVIFEYIDIETIIRSISRKIPDNNIENANLIFVDTFYKDEQSDAYALDYFEMYRTMSQETKRNTQGKYKVMIGIDDIDERLKSKTISNIDVIDERTRISSLLGKAHRHPYIEWGIDKGSKTEKIIKEIERYAEKNKIYLYRNAEMSLEEWIEYISSLARKINALINDIENEKLSNSGIERLNTIIDNYRNVVNNTTEILGLSGKDGIKTIKSAVKYTKNLYNSICRETYNLMTLGVDENNRKLMNIAHHFINEILSVGYVIRKTERSFVKDRN